MLLIAASDNLWHSAYCLGSDASERAWRLLRKLNRKTMKGFTTWKHLRRHSLRTKRLTMWCAKVLGERAPENNGMATRTSLKQQLRCINVQTCTGTDGRSCRAIGTTEKQLGGRLEGC